MAITEADIDRRMQSHQLTNDQQINVDSLRSALTHITKEVLTYVPAGREQSLMVTHLEEALMWGVKAIALDGN